MNKIFLLDGATGSLLQREGMERSTEEFVLSHKDIMRRISGDYAVAGSCAVLAPTFGANRAKYGGDCLAVNRELVALTKEAGVLVGGCCGTDPRFIKALASRFQVTDKLPHASDFDNGGLVCSSRYVAEFKPCEPISGTDFYDLLDNCLDAEDEIININADNFDIGWMPELVGAVKKPLVFSGSHCDRDAITRYYHGKTMFLD